jgi:hypothetical protein
MTILGSRPKMDFYDKVQLVISVVGLIYFVYDIIISPEHRGFEVLFSCLFIANILKAFGYKLKP